MGCPVFQAPESSAARGTAGAACPDWPPTAAGSTAAPRRPAASWRPLVQPPMPHPSLEELGAVSGEAGWSEWTSSIRRSLRQRAEVFHTQAPAEPAPAPAPEPGPSPAAGEPGAEAVDGGGAAKRKRGGARHTFSLRLGYDPRIFLEDPALRNQQLTPEAEAWAAGFRARIPMATDPQLARRLEPEPPGRSSPPAPAAAAAERRLPWSSSEEEEEEAAADENAFRVWGRHLAGRARARRPPDDPPVTLFVLERLAQDARFAGATIQERLSRVGEAISAATRELNRADLPARERERMIEWHARRVQRLQRLQAEWPLPGQAGREPPAPVGGLGESDEGLSDLVD